MAIYKYSHKLYSPTACGGGNRILTKTDEIMTVLLTTFTPPPTQTSISHSSSQAAAATFDWLHVYAFTFQCRCYKSPKASSGFQQVNFKTSNHFTQISEFFLLLSWTWQPDPSRQTRVRPPWWWTVKPECYRGPGECSWQYFMCTSSPIQEIYICIQYYCVIIRFIMLGKKISE